MDEISFARAEALRKKTLRAYVAAFAAAAAGVAVFFLFPPLGVVLVFAAAAAGGFYGRKKRNEFAACYKELVVRDALNGIFEDVCFFPGRGISEETVESTGMMDTGDRFFSNDLVCAKYKNIPFVQSDVDISERRSDSDGHTHYETIFRGRWMTFEFNKTFGSDIQVISSGFGASRRKGGFFAREGEKMHRVKLEDDEFNKLFSVYSHSEHEAFYVLTPHVMEALKGLARSWDIPMMLMFTGGQLHVAADTGEDAFEPGSVMKRLCPEKDRERAVRETRVVCAFADALRLDNDIYGA